MANELQQLKVVQQDKRSRLSPLTDQTLLKLKQMLVVSSADNTIMKEDPEIEIAKRDMFLQKIKYLPSDLVERLFNILSPYEKGLYYAYFLNSTYRLIEINLWFIRDYNKLFSFLSNKEEFGNLEQLTINSCNGLSKVGTSDSLISMLQNTSISFLSLCDDLAGLKHNVIKSVFQHSQKLSILVLSAQLMQDDALAPLHEVPNNLVKLKLYDCYHLSGVGLDHISKCTSLRSVVLQDSRKINNESLRRFCSPGEGDVRSLLFWR